MTKQFNLRLTLAMVAVLVVLAIAAGLFMALTPSTALASSDLYNGLTITLWYDGSEVDYSTNSWSDPIELSFMESPMGAITAEFQETLSGDPVAVLFYFRTWDGTEGEYSYDHYTNLSYDEPQHPGLYRMCWYLASDPGITLADKEVIASADFRINPQEVMVSNNGTTFYYTGKAVNYVPYVSDPAYEDDFGVKINWAGGVAPVKPGSYAYTLSLVEREGCTKDIDDYAPDHTMAAGTVTIEKRQIDVYTVDTLPYNGKQQNMYTYKYHPEGDEAYDPNFADDYLSLDEVISRVDSYIVDGYTNVPFTDIGSVNCGIEIKGPVGEVGDDDYQEGYRDYYYFSKVEDVPLEDENHNPILDEYGFQVYGTVYTYEQYGNFTITAAKVPNSAMALGGEFGSTYQYNEGNSYDGWYVAVPGASELSDSETYYLKNNNGTYSEAHIATGFADYESNPGYYIGYNGMLASEVGETLYKAGTLLDRIVSALDKLPGYDYGGTLTIDSTSLEWATGLITSDEQASELGDPFYTSDFDTNAADIGQEYTLRVYVFGNSDYSNSWVYVPFTVDKIKLFARTDAELEYNSTLQRPDFWSDGVDVYQYRVGGPKANTSYNIIYNYNTIEEKNAGTYPLSLEIKDGYDGTFVFVDADTDKGATYTIAPKTLYPSVVSVGETDPRDSGADIVYGNTLELTFAGVEESDMEGEDNKVQQDIQQIVMYKYTVNPGEWPSEWQNWDVENPLRDVGYYLIKYDFVDRDDEDGAVNYVSIGADSSFNFHVIPAELTVTVADGQTKIYGEDDPTDELGFDFGVSGSQYDDNVARSTTFFGGSVSRAEGEDVDTYDYENKLSLNGKYAQNYTINFSDGGYEFSITKRDLTVTAENKNVVFNDDKPVYSVTYSGWAFGQGPAVLGGTLGYDSEYSKGNDVNDIEGYLVTPYGLSSDNYNIIYVPGRVYVEAKAVTVSLSAGNLVYAKANKLGVITGSYDDVKGDPRAAVITLVDGEDDVNVGSFLVSISIADTNYRVDWNELHADQYDYDLDMDLKAFVAEFEITQAPLSITANPKTIIYGDAPANDGVSYSGFVGGEDEGKIEWSGTLQYAYTYEQFGDVGSYTITPSGVTTDNYAITFYTGVLTVEEADFISATVAQDGDYTYNGYGQVVAKTIDYKTVNDQTATFTYSLTNGSGYQDTVPAITNAGDTTTVYWKATAPNHNELTGSFTVSIAKANLTVKVRPETIEVGQTPYYKADSFVLPDKFTFEGFQGEDDYTCLTNNDLDVDCPTYVNAKGSYDLEHTGSVSSNNYNISYEDSTLVISESVVVVTITSLGDIVSSGLTYGNSLPAITASYSWKNPAGKPETVDMSGYTIGKLAYDTTYAVGSDVGSYSVKAKGLDESEGSYSFDYDSAALSFTVKKRSITVYWDEDTFSFTYDGNNHRAQPLFVQNNGPIAGDEGKLGYVVSGANSQAGNWTAVITGLEGPKAGNYQLPAFGLSQAYVINPKAVDVTLTLNETLEYTGNDKVVSGSYTNVSSVADYATVNYLLGTDRKNAGNFYVTVETGNANYVVNTVVSEDMASVNYADGKATVQFTITKKNLYINAKANTITYGDAPANDGVSYSGFVTGENENNVASTGSIVYKYNYSQYGNVGNGEYTIIIVDSTLGYANYTPLYTNGTLTVVAKPVVVELNKFYSTYTGEHMAPAGYYTDVNGIKRDAAIAVKEDDDDVNVGEFTIVITPATNYALAVEDGCGYEVEGGLGYATYEITKAPLTITPYGNTITYGQAPSGNGVLYQGWLKGQNQNTVDAISGQLTYTFNYEQNQDRGNGNWKIFINTSALVYRNYEVSYNEGTLVVNKADFTGVQAMQFGTLTYTGKAQSAVPYITATAVNNQPITYTYKRADDNDYGDMPTFTDADSYTVFFRVSAPNHNNYGGSFTVTIDKAPLVITANPKTIIYGQAAANDGVSYDGFVEGEDETTEGLFAGELAFAYTYDQAAADTRKVGTYVITPSGLTAANYVITYNTGALKVEKATLTMAIVANNTVYGTAFVQPTFESGITVQGWQYEEDTIAALVNDNNYTYVYAPVGDTQSFEDYMDSNYQGWSEDIPVDAGDYYFGAAIIELQNYKMVYASDTFTIAKKELAVAVDAKAITYGDAIPTYTVTLTGFVYNETRATAVSGDAAFTCSYKQFADATQYDITATVGTLAAANYSFKAPVAAKLTVAKKAIRVLVIGGASRYGNAQSDLIATAEEGAIVNNDTAYTLHCDVDETTPVGFYKITGSVANNNYTITFLNEDGSYHVSARTISIAIADKTSVEGSARVALTADESQIVNGDKNVYSLSCAVNADTLIGEYDITATALDGNYDITFTGSKGNKGTYTVTPKVVEKTNENGETVQELSRDVEVEDATEEKGGVSVVDIISAAANDNKVVALEIKVGDTATLNLDKAALQKLAENGDVKVSFETKQGEAAVAAGKNYEMVLEISLKNASGDAATFEGGKVVVTADFDNQAPGGKVAKVFYVDANGKKTDMKATFADGKVSFETDHFSTYAVAYVLSGGSIAAIIIACVVAVAAVVVVVFLMKKKGAKPAKAAAEEAPAADAE